MKVRAKYSYKQLKGGQIYEVRKIFYKAVGIYASFSIETSGGKLIMRDEYSYWNSDHFEIVCPSEIRK